MPASTSVGAAVVLPGNQPPVPAENRVRCDDAGDLRQNPPAEFLASHRESTALGVGQAKWTWAKLLPEDPSLLPEIIDHVYSHRPCFADSPTSAALLHHTGTAAALLPFSTFSA